MSQSTIQGVQGSTPGKFPEMGKLQTHLSPLPGTLLCCPLCNTAICLGVMVDNEDDTTNTGDAIKQNSGVCSVARA